MKERHAKTNNDEGRRLTWAMERTGSASLYAMTRRPTGRATDVLEMRGDAEEEGGERATVTTQEEITKLYNE